MAISKNTLLLGVAIILAVLLSVGVYMYGKARAEKAYAECEKAHAIHASEIVQTQNETISTVISMPASEKRKALDKWVK